MNRDENISRHRTPDSFSVLEMYGDRQVFVRRAQEGFTEIAFGRGDWVGDNNRVVAVFIFYHPNGKITTIEHHKFREGLTTARGHAETEYTEETWDQFQKDNKIQVVGRTNLTDLINHWQGN